MAEIWYLYATLNCIWILRAIATVRWKGRKVSEMKRRMWFGSACVAVCCAVGTASAGVVGWWRFNGEGANVPNVAATAGLPDSTPRATDGTIISIDTYGASPVYGSTAAEMPVVTNLFQQVAPRLIDQKTGTVYAGGKTLHFDGNNVNGGVIIPYDEAFNLSNCTIEVVMRIPPEAATRSDRMFPLVQFGRDSIEGWFFAVYRSDNLASGGVPYVRGNFIDTSGKDQTNKGSTTGATSYIKDMPSLFDGNWHRLALYLRYNSGTTPSVTAAYYVDGNCCGGMTFNNWKQWKLTGNCPLAIGCQPYATNTRTFWGDIAEVRISDTVQYDNQFFVPLVNGPVDKDTALMLTFDDVAKGLGFNRQYVVPCQQTAGSGSTNYMWYAKNWDIHNAATNNPFIPRWYPFSDAGKANHLVDDLRPTFSNDTWGATMGVDDALFASAGSLNIPTYQPEGEAAPGTDVINVPYPACTLPSGDFTLECVFKTEAASTSEMDTFINCPFLKWGVTNGKVLARGFGTSYGTGSDLTSPWTVNDGQWHHAAVIYKDGYFSHFVDYKRVSRMAKTLYVTSNTGATFFIGAVNRTFLAGTSTSSSQAFRGKIDAVRITRRALTTGEFLSTRSEAKLMTMTFDDTEAPYAVGQEGAIAPSTGVAGALDGGEAPEIENGRAGWYVLDGENGTNKVECGKAVKFAGSTILWPKTTLMERNDLTVEFFARYSDLRSTANILRYIRAGATGAQVTDSIIWGLWAQNGTNWRLDIRAVTNGVLSANQSGGNFATITETDNKWHHWALTVDATSGTNVVAKLYKDYEQLGNTVTLTGQLDLPTLGGAATGLSIGGTGVAGAYIYGTFDQVRVSAGILPVDKFMRHELPVGTTLFVR